MQLPVWSDKDQNGSSTREVTPDDCGWSSIAGEGARSVPFEAAAAQGGLNAAKRARVIKPVWYRDEVHRSPSKPIDDESEEAERLNGG